jgi:deazaflavin-dependent oxidoreductase (nitroreductase family)
VKPRSRSLGRLARTTRLTPPRRLVNALVTPLARAGLGPANTYLLSVRGRRTGRRYTTPVTLVEHDGERWLVAPFGVREWVKNARAAGAVELRRGRRTTRARVTEIPPDERAPILKAYVARVPLVARFFDAPPDAPVEAFAAEAERHPVFRLRPQPR